MKLYPLMHEIIYMSFVISCHLKILAARLPTLGSAMVEAEGIWLLVLIMVAKSSSLVVNSAPTLEASQLEVSNCFMAPSISPPDNNPSARFFVTLRYSLSTGDVCRNSVSSRDVHS